MRLLRSLSNRPCTFYIPQAKYNSQHPIKFLETQDKWREKDGVPRNWELIYKAPMDPWLNYMTTYISASTAIIGCSGLYYAAFAFNPATMNDPVILGEDVVVANSAVECLVYLGAFFAFNAAIRTLLSKYVVRLYQDGDNYLAIFPGHFYNSITKYEFNRKDFTKLRPTFVVTWGHARFGLGNKHAILLEHYFKTPNHFNYLLHRKGSVDPTKEDE